MTLLKTKWVLAALTGSGLMMPPTVAFANDCDKGERSGGFLIERTAADNPNEVEIVWVKDAVVTKTNNQALLAAAWQEGEPVQVEPGEPLSPVPVEEATMAQEETPVMTEEEFLQSQQTVQLQNCDFQPRGWALPIPPPIFPPEAVIAPQVFSPVGPVVAPVVPYYGVGGGFHYYPVPVVHGPYFGPVVPFGGYRYRVFAPRPYFGGPFGPRGFYRPGFVGPHPIFYR